MVVLCTFVAGERLEGLQLNRGTSAEADAILFFSVKKDTSHWGGLAIGWYYHNIISPTESYLVVLLQLAPQYGVKGFQYLALDYSPLQLAGLPNAARVTCA